MSDDFAKRLRADANAYRESLALPDTNDMFSLAYQWQDKKHRHVYDLCGKLEIAASRIEKLEAALRKIKWIATPDHEEARYKATEIARKALEGKDG